MLALPRSRPAFIVAGILASALVLRGAWLTADPPTRSVGIVWHDEGAWVHNARNIVLWGEWRTDDWNPVFIAPVFTALEAAAFSSLGVGTWQARTVPAISGIAAIVLLMAGLAASAGRRAALAGGALLAFNYTWVMWNRAALMESTMTACMVAAWAAYAMSSRRPIWGLAAGTAATLAFFTKAAAAFFIAALAVEAIVSLAMAQRMRRAAPETADATAASRRAALWTLVGLAGSAAAIGVAFVLPHWTDYQFYNWQMTVVRKPSYDLRSLIDRASWIPMVQDIFTRMWPVLAAGVVAAVGILSRWRHARPSDRLLVLWILIGLVELTIHDSGAERRYVMFVPAFVALAASLFGATNGLIAARIRDGAIGTRLVLAAIAAVFLYVLIGSAARLLFLDEVLAGNFRTAVRLSAALAGLGAAILFFGWRPIAQWAAGRRVPVAALFAVIVASIGWDAWSYARWAGGRTHLNYRASLALGEALPPGTLVHGKLANGLSLENQIRPVFVGRGFGNYDDRFERDDVRYILTYILPREGYESQPGLIQEMLDRYPEHRAIATFDVDETPGSDRVALIEKRPGVQPAAVSGS